MINLKSDIKLLIDNIYRNHIFIYLVFYLHIYEKDTCIFNVVNITDRCKNEGN